MKSLWPRVTVCALAMAAGCGSDGGYPVGGGGEGEGEDDPCKEERSGNRRYALTPGQARALPSRQTSAAPTPPREASTVPRPGGRREGARMHKRKPHLFVSTTDPGRQGGN